MGIRMNYLSGELSLPQRRQEAVSGKNLDCSKLRGVYILFGDLQNKLQLYRIKVLFTLYM